MMPPDRIHDRPGEASCPSGNRSKRIPNPGRERLGFGAEGSDRHAAIPSKNLQGEGPDAKRARFRCLSTPIIVPDRREALKKPTRPTVRESPLQGAPISESA